MDISSNAKFALVIAEVQSENGFDKRTRWQNFVGNIYQSTIQPSGTKKIHDNVWLISLDNGLPFLSKLLDWSGSYIQFRILFLEAEPDWLTYPAEEKPTS